MQRYKHYLNQTNFRLKNKQKTIKTPLMTAESDALSYWPVTIVPERKCSHMATVHYGFILKLSHHEWQKQKKQFVRYPMFCTTEMVFWRLKIKPLVYFLPLLTSPNLGEEEVIGQACGHPPWGSRSVPARGSGGRC